MNGTQVARFAVAVALLSASARATPPSAAFPDQPTPPALRAPAAPPTPPEVPLQVPPQLRASTALPPASPALTEPAVPRVQIDGCVALGGGFDNVFALTQVDVTYRVVPFLLIGGYIEHPFVLKVEDSDACWMTGNCPANYVSFGPRAELQPFTEGIVVPWFGAELGLALLDGGNVKSFALETTFDLGVEIRPVKALGIGPYLATKLFLTDPHEVDPRDIGEGNAAPVLPPPRVISLGLRVAGQF